MSDDDRLDPHLSRWAQLGQSWLAMKSWVKTWLRGVIAVFLAALVFLRRVEAQ